MWYKNATGCLKFLMVTGYSCTGKIGAPSNCFSNLCGDSILGKA